MHKFWTDDVLAPTSFCVSPHWLRFSWKTDGREERGKRGNVCKWERLFTGFLKMERQTEGGRVERRKWRGREEGRPRRDILELGRKEPRKGLEEYGNALMSIVPLGIHFSLFTTSPLPLSGVKL